jgi:alginate O-acetyltransferase complex protein AlgI
MLFNSVQFFIFFPIVTIAYFALPQRYRWPLLLVASCYFYMAFIPIYILILFFTISVDFTAGILIENAQGRRRKLFLIGSLLANVGVLAFFKYFNFANDNLLALARLIGWSYPLEHLAIILPIGLSFHTFQSLSYTIEVYRGHYPAERHPGILALYVMFYPQLVAGPIERPQNMLHQFREQHTIEYQRIVGGLQLMAWGLFKKVVIADRLAIAVNQVYNQPTNYSGFSLIIATVGFAYQIYCDFSGYSDIAIGAAQVMGFRLMTNFKRPYHSKSIAEFWKRWHISLSTWFRDYLYISLGGNRVPKWRWQFNLLITFLISGLWHGANWTFVVWGALHGFYLILSIWTEGPRRKLMAVTRLDSRPRIAKGMQMTVTFALVCFAWIFFRANTISDAAYIATHLFSGIGNLSSDFALGLSWGNWLVALIAIGVLEVVQWIQRHQSMREVLSRRPVWVRWGVYYGLVASTLILGMFQGSQFIYFQF